MASRFVECKDKEQALAMFDAGLLWINWGADYSLARPMDRWISLARPMDRWIVSERYDSLGWAARDFLYLIEEDDSPVTEDDDPAQ